MLLSAARDFRSSSVEFLGMCVLTVGLETEALVWLVVMD